MPTGDIMRSEPDTDLVIPYLYGVIPETATPCWWAGNLVDVIDQNINFTLLRLNLFEEICYLLVLTMIYSDTMTNAASGINCLDTGFYGELALTCSAARAIAQPLPIPRVAPVTTQILPFRLLLKKILPFRCWN